MFCLHVANRTENLLRHLAEVIRVDPQADLFAPELFLIQSQGMERMVSQRLADSFASFCNYRFFLPLEFFGDIAEKLGLGINPAGFSRKILTWRIELLLTDLGEDECYRPLRNYLCGENLDLKRYQLARRLANVFDQYQVMRTDILDAWEAGQIIDHPTASWQMALWRRLLRQGGDTFHRGSQLRRVITRLTAGEDLSALLPKRIAIVGLHSLPPLFLDCLRGLSLHMDIHFLLLSPCRKYWGDVERPAQRLRRRLFTTNGATPDTSVEHHPLLAALGGQGRELHNLLLERVPFCLDFASYELPEGSQPYHLASLLQRLQSDLLDDRLPVPGDRCGKDQSVQVVSCHSRLREMQVLRDHLLHLLHGDETLELRDIVVMAPDIQEYSPLIPAVFSDFGHSIADRSLRRRNPLINAFLAFLELFVGRFGWSELLDFLAREGVYPQFQLVAGDLEQLREWVLESGIRWGLSGEQRHQDGLPPFAETCWRAGLDRLLMGYAVDSPDAVDGIIPFSEIEGRSAQPLGGLCRYVEVIESARGDFGCPHRLVDWSQLLLGYTAVLFGPGESRELLELREILFELDEPLANYHDCPVGFAVIREWFSQATGESRSSSGFMRGQLTFCSMLPMRSIPFQVVCLVGLNDGIFPKIDRQDSFDLLAASPRPGDRSGRGDDRYQFLEALLSARSNLYLSYIGQSIRTNAPIPPSVVVGEFLELLADRYGIADMVVRHPLHPFSGKYFLDGGTDRLFSFSVPACVIAQKLREPQPSAISWWQGELDIETGSVAVDRLVKFYANPQRFFISHCLGLPLTEETELPEERELFRPSALARYQLAEELIRHNLGEDEGGDPLARAMASARWPLGAPGALAGMLVERQLAPFLRRLAFEEMGAACPDQTIDLQLGRYRLTGRLNGIHQNGVLVMRSGRLRGRDLLAGWIRHLLAAQLGLSSRTRIVAMDQTIGFHGGGEAGQLLALVDHFAAGCRKPSPLLIEPAYLYVRSQKQALAKARKMVDDLLERGRQPEWLLLYGEEGEGLDWEAFELACQGIIQPVWRAADVC